MKPKIIIDSYSELFLFDLNLLVVFETVYYHKSVTMASCILNISPATVSQSLNKLRDHYSDPLFVRKGRGIMPTLLADNLYKKLRKQLEELKGVVDPHKLKKTRSEYVVYAPLSFCINYLWRIIQTIKESGSSYKVTHHDTVYDNDIIEMLLNYRRADIAVTLSPIANQQFICVPCIMEQSILVYGKKHGRPPITGTEDLQGYRELLVEHEFVKVLSGSNKLGVDEKSNSLRSEAILTSNSMLALMTVISQTNCIGFVPESYLNLFGENLGLQPLGEQFDVHELTTYLVFRKASLKDRGFCDLLKVIKKETGMSGDIDSLCPD